MRNSKRVDILIVDDLPEKHLVYRASLDDLDQNIVSVTSGEEALLKLIERDFAVILLDVNMPGMSGHETAKLIRQRRRSRHTPIIFVTAFADEAQTAEGLAPGTLRVELAMGDALAAAGRKDEAKAYYAKGLRVAKEMRGGAGEKWVPEVEKKMAGL